MKCGGTLTGDIEFDDAHEQSVVSSIYIDGNVSGWLQVRIAGKEIDLLLKVVDWEHELNCEAEIAGNCFL